ncbi:Superfamily I DNA or RNA helicase [Candidatus Methanophagaceae archaeon]|nr:Superfamily I DNA or RNA helicase [Methanophagales archaeon]
MNDRNDQEKDRKRYSDLILNAPAKKKIIVAGAGTGKTFTFQELLKGKNGKALALTFINNLADDLKEDLDGLAESRTFHGYCIKLLRRAPFGGINADFHIFPKLSKIIKSDEQILFGREPNFDEAFQCLLEDDGHIDFYIGRANFYNAVGFNDSVYRMLQYFKSGSGEPPQYEQVVIDEFQDFNRLEVAFIEKMEKVNPILIVGDDDQAIYYDLKNASPDFIREKAKDPDYERFELPYCSRCTKVIVDAVDDVITHAKANGNLTDRVDKKYTCYLPKKLQDCRNYPKIVHAKCSVHTKHRSPYISRYIEREIQKIPIEEINLANKEDYPCVLIIGPKYYLSQINDFLINKSYKVDYVGKKKDNNLHILDGYKILLKDRESNLGWRIIFEFDKVENMNDIIGMTNTDDHVDIVEQLPEGYRCEHEKVIDLLNHLKENTASIEEQNELKKIMGLDLNEIKSRLEIEEEGENDEFQDTDPQERGQPSIKLTTFQGCKGLSGGFVFIVGLNDGTMPVKPYSPTDNEVCQFIVALTRARKKCYLISNRGFGKEYGLSPSKFIDWIDESRLSIKEVNKEYF